jgi:hypothetical protein
MTQTSKQLMDDLFFTSGYGMRFILFDGLNGGKVAIDRVSVWALEELEVKGSPCCLVMTVNGCKLTICHSMTETLDMMECYDLEQYDKQKESWRQRSIVMAEAKKEWENAEKEVGAGKSVSKHTEIKDGKKIVTLTYDLIEEKKDDGKGTD